MSTSDSLYHRLFSHPQMVEEIVRHFLPTDVARELDFRGLQRVNVKFSADRGGRRREGDVIWRLPTAGGTDIYLYLLLEFQSKSDWWMAVRTQVYEGLLWQQIIDETRLKAGSRLPPVFMLVLYNGETRWTAPSDLAELIALPEQSPLWHWQPQIRYYVLDMGAMPGEELAARQDSLAALLFRLEQRQDPSAIPALVGELVGWFRAHPGARELERLFNGMVRQVIENMGIQTDIPSDLLEMSTVLATLGQTWKKESRAEGLAEGEARGRAEGRAEGRAAALIHLAERRFGALPDDLRQRIMSADSTSVEQWFDRAIDAPDLRSVFETGH